MSILIAVLIIGGWFALCALLMLVTGRGARDADAYEEQERIRLYNLGHDPR